MTARAGARGHSDGGKVGYVELDVAVTARAGARRHAPPRAAEKFATALAGGRWARMLYHLVAHAAAGRRPLTSSDSCWTLWWQLRRLFGDVVAACLMPDHLHLVLHAASGDDARRALGNQLGGFARYQRVGRVWQPVPTPMAVLGDDKLERLIRYLALNPVRGGFVEDPMSWLWSTHRDVIGARADPWVTAEALSTALARSRCGFEEWFHRYVSSDPSVAVLGTPLPEVGTSGSLDEIADAARFAVPRSFFQRRHLFVLTATALGHARGAIAAYLGVAPYTVTRWAHRPAPELLRAGLLCLGDERLRTPPRFRRLRAA